MRKETTGSHISSTHGLNELTRARAVLEAEAAAIRAIPLDEHFLRAVEIMRKCKGKVITTGMGKVGIIANKLATTLSSTGTPACFLHPGEAAHGDLGLVSKHDVMITFSNSGKTREVREMIARAKKLNGMHLIAITGHRSSPIARQSDVVLYIGPVKEPCPLGLTPSASTTAMLALSDALALVLLEKKGFTKADYAKFHHGGYLGKKARREARHESDSSELGSLGVRSSESERKGTDKLRTDRLRTPNFPKLRTPN